MLGYGRITLVSSEDSTKPSVFLRYELSASGIRFFLLNAADTRYVSQSIQEVLEQLEILRGDLTADSALKYAGGAVLMDLPAAPADAFQNLTLTYQSNSLSITIRASDPFAFSAQKLTHFENLELTFSEQLGTGRLDVAGRVTAVILGSKIPLSLGLGEDGRLAFIPDSSREAIAIGDWGWLDVTSFAIRPSGFSTTGLQALYTFDEGQGTTVYDCSGVVPAIDLQFRTATEPVQWGAGHLTLRENALISSGLPAQNSGSASTAKRLIDACLLSNQFTLLAWVKSFDQLRYPDRAPARIVTLSKNISERCFTLGEERKGGSQNLEYRYITRFRTSETSSNGTQKGGDAPLLDTPSPRPSSINCLAYTFAPQEGNSQHKNAKLYVNGSLREDCKLEGKINWPTNDAAYVLVLGNEATYPGSNHSNNRTWQGDLHQVAIFNRALSPEEIYQHYYPVLEIQGQFRLQNAPAPLDAPFLATLVLEQPGSRHLEVTVNEVGVRQVADLLHVTAVEMVLRQPLPEVGVASSRWALHSGRVESVLWGNSLSFKMQGTADSGGVNLALVTPASGSGEVSIKLEGLNTLVFSRLELQSQRTDNGAIWQFNSTTDMTEVPLPRVRDGRPFDFNVDFKLRLTPPVLGFEPTGDGQRVVLNGRWLDQSLALYGDSLSRGFVLRDAIALQLPFQIYLDPIADPDTGLPLVNPMTLTSEMAATVELELTSLGFLAYVSGTFPWTGPDGVTHRFTIPPFPVVKPPLTPNQVLDLLLEKLRESAGTIVAPVFRHAEDYFFTTLGDRPVLYLGNHVNAFIPQHITELPSLFRLPQKPVTTTAFSLEAAEQGYILKVSPGGLSQRELKADYQNFLAQVEARSPLPGALTLLKSRIAERLPVTLDQLLYYYYGFEPDQNSIDLHGGMRLRVDYQTYQFVHPTSASASSGFVGSGTTYYHLNNAWTADAMPQLGLDAFLATLSLTVQPNQAQLGLGGGIDLFRAGYRKAYGRLVYPRQMAGRAGLPNGERTAALIGANSLRELQMATDTLLDQGELVATNNALSVFFQGRATVIPEIAIFVQGQAEYVSVGTTLRQVLERYGSVPLGLPNQALKLQTGTPRLSRLIHKGADHAPSYRFVNLGSAPPATTRGLDSYDLPLVKGDRIFI